MSCLRCPPIIILQSTASRRTRPRVAHATCTAKRYQVPRQRPQWCRCRDLSLLVSPAIPADTLSAGRPHKTAHAPRQRLSQAGAESPRQVGVPLCRASLDLFESSTGSLRNRLFKKKHSRPEGRQTVWPSSRGNEPRRRGRPHAPPTGGSQIHAGSFSYSYSSIRLAIEFMRLYPRVQFLAGFSRLGHVSSPQTRCSQSSLELGTYSYE